MSVAEITRNALTLPPEDRAALAAGLLDSLDGVAETDDVEAAWSREIAGRLDDVRGGRVRTVSWEDAAAMIRADERPDV